MLVHRLIVLRLRLEEAIVMLVLYRLGYSQGGAIDLD